MKLHIVLLTFVLSCCSQQKQSRNIDNYYTVKEGENLIEVIKKMESQNDDYGEDEFREALIIAQGEKCCFCEKPIDGGQIEHFRPKKAYQTTPGQSLIRPGYYWLAYDWKNLLISCSKCNSSGQKGNLFPITGARATSPKHNLTDENPILINPAEEDPSLFISFNYEVPVSIDPNDRGLENIKIFKLKDRADLKPIRFDRFDRYRTLKKIAALTAPTGDISQENIRDAKRFLKFALRKKQPFSGMLRENIKKGLL